MTIFYSENDIDLSAFTDVTAQTLDPAQVPFAAAVEKNVPIYDVPALGPQLANPKDRQALQSEWVAVLQSGAGALVLKGACPDLNAVDRATQVFNGIIADERTKADGKGDHFAASGANDRIWNALQKHCLTDPEGFARYMALPVIDALCAAWLGPHYQMTAQVNQVRPGGAAQTAHRDYHLGFQSQRTAAAFPRHIHALSPALTLQGAIAHCDMPIESGPTKLLPFSQTYPPGYLAFHDPAHKAHFEDACVQLPLSKGDALFFSPALFHAAGANHSADIHRMANLLQVSSPMGRAMEAMDRSAMVRAVFPALHQAQHSGTMEADQIAAVIAATAEGYAFPTNLDTDPPTGGAAPQTQADILRLALDEGWTITQLENALTQQATRRLP